MNSAFIITSHNFINVEVKNCAYGKVRIACFTSKTLNTNERYGNDCIG